MDKKSRAGKGKGQVHSRIEARTKKEAALRKQMLEKKRAAMKVQEEKNPELDAKIDSAMEKIIQETLGADKTTSVFAGEKDKKDKTAETPVNSDGPRRKKGIWIVSGVVAAALLAGYVGGTVYYKNHFFKNTSINNIVCGNLTAEEAENRIREKVEDYSLNVQFRENVTQEIPGSEIGYKYVSAGDVDRLLKEQNAFAWIGGMFRKELHTTESQITFDKEALKSKIETFECMQESFMTPPTDAYIAFQDNQFIVRDETQGTSIEKDVLVQAVEQAVEASQPSVSAEESGAYVKPAVTKEDPALVKQKDIWNSCAAATITYTFGNQQEVLDGMTIKDWLSYDENGNYVETEDSLEKNIQQFVKGLANKYDTAGKDRVITSTATGQPVTVVGGNYGFAIDQKKERVQLLEEIKSHSVVAREPVYAKKGVGAYGENEIGNTYIEIDLSSQHLWYYKDGALLMDTDLVSGTYVMADRRTPGGTYSLMYKQTDQVLRGAKKPDGTYEYEQPVRYWMPFNGGIGLHDADWRYYFGGSIYMTSGSHGCINLPIPAARTIYENVEAGMPIICFYRS